MRRKIVNKPLNFNLVPQLAVDPANDIFIFPFYPALGFSDRGAKLEMGEKLYNSVINGNKPIILKWLGAENALTWDDPVNISQASVFKRNWQIGESLRGRVADADYSNTFESKATGFVSAEGNPVNFTEQAVQKVIRVITTSDFFYKEGTNNIDVEKLRLFFIIPELTERDPLYIENASPVFDENQKVSYTEIIFVSLGDKLRSIGRTLEGLIHFEGIGEPSPFPNIAPEQNNNDTIFYDLTNSETKDIPNTKRIWVQKKTPRGAKYVQIDFNGLAGFQGIQIMGRREIGADKVGRCVPIWLGDAQDTITETFDKSAEKEMTAVSFNVLNANWWAGDDWKKNYGVVFDPNKLRNDIGYLKLLTDKNDYDFPTFNVNSNNKQNATIYGTQHLRYIPWSKYKLEAYLEANTAKMKYRGQKKSNLTNINMSEWLNTTTAYNWYNDEIEYGNVKTHNIKEMVSQIATSILSVAGSAIGAGVGWVKSKGAIGVGIGSFIGGQLGTVFNALFKIVPAKWFNYDTEVFNPPVPISCLVPKRFVSAVRAKMGDDNQEKIPLALFKEPIKNELSGLLNTGIFNSSYTFELTDEIKYKSKKYNSTVFLDKRSDFDLQPDHAITGLHATNINYVIDLLKIKAINQAPFKISFFDENKIKIWETTMMSQSGFTANLFDYATLLLTNDFEYNHMDKDDRWKLPVYLDRTPELTDAFDKKGNKLLAQKFLGSLTEVNLIKKETETNWKSYTTSYSQKTREWHIPDQNWKKINIDLGIPLDIDTALEKYYYNDLASIDNMNKKIQKLKTDWGFENLRYGFENINIVADFDPVPPVYINKGVKDWIIRGFKHRMSNYLREDRVPIIKGVDDQKYKTPFPIKNNTAFKEDIYMTWEYWEPARSGGILTPKTSAYWKDIRRRGRLFAFWGTQLNNFKFNWNHLEIDHAIGLKFELKYADYRTLYEPNVANVELDLLIRMDTVFKLVK